MERVRTISRRDLVPYDSSARSSLLGVNRSRSLIKCNWNGRVVAVKFLTEDAQEDVLFERAQSWHSFPHQNVGQVLGVSDRACSPLFVVLPYYSNGNIIQFLARHPHFNRKSMILDIARGMQCLHSHDIIHGGLKPTNIMISDNMQVCITDFEMVRVQPSRNNESHRYFSPEAWKGLVSPASDVYAFAMSVYEILTSKVPWGSLSMKYIFQLVVGQNARPDRPETTDMTDKEWSIMEESWDKEPRLRPTFDIIIRMWQDPNEAAYSTRGGRYRRDNSLPLPPGSRWSDTTATSPPAYEPSSMTVPRPLPIPVQYSSTPSTAQSSRPHHSTDSGQYVSAHTELHSPPYTASSLSSSSASSSYSLFSPRIPLTPMSAPMGPPMQEGM
ncbi:kinase-like protein [Dendrothele bispora CBS 962.96]|uniref:Kinase-like protein n=1 Tax=Dendrothele bispora (strain CBS 962.96) TaxID=1314807 RepID=A0A4S8MCT7_DENBC|nr:kinase-like protein [Dendrothele bispora CBS 962.96]